MSFDAAARVAPEEQGMPTCLPPVSSTGDAGAIMNFETKTGITAELIIPIDPMKAQPTVCFAVPWLGGKHIFNAAGLLDLAARGVGMIFPKSYHDDPEVVIDAADVRKLANLIRKQVSPAIGRFEVKFVGSDLPF